MYEQIREDTVFIMLYAVVIAIATIACCYLLFRQGNAFARDVTPPVRLRRWTAAFFASITLNHLWYMPIFFLSSSEDVVMIDLIGGVLDSMTAFPLAIVILFVMLQDRRRPLWPVAVMMVPLVVGGAICIAIRSYAFAPLYVYFLLMCIGIIIYMVRALRQYGRWLRDNYADLEHTAGWQSFVVLFIILLVFGIYAFTGEGPVYQYAMQLIIIVLACYLLWRVETLSSLTPDPIPIDAPTLNLSPIEEGSLYNNLGETSVNVTNPLSNRRGSGGEAIGTMLQQHCIEMQLYLQHDLTLLQLAKAIGTNRFYLSQYFSSQGTTYNAYINDLRINHFVSICREAIASKRSFTSQQLAQESGFRSYSTFSSAFKRKMGLAVTVWMRTQSPNDADLC